MKTTLFLIALFKVILQTSAQTNVDLSTPLPISKGVQISGGSAHDMLGYSVSSAGDVNNDGVDDLIIGAASASPSGRSGAGIAYVIYGKDDGVPTNIDLSTPLPISKGVQISGGLAGDALGYSVSSAGDVNKDGVGDIIVGAYAAMSLSGTVYVIYGKSGGFTANIDLNTALPSSEGFQIRGGSAHDMLGYSVSSAGDVNNDGVDDIIIGAASASPSGRSGAGIAYVIYGKYGGPANVNLNNPIPLSEGFQISGGSANDGLAISLSSAGDVNNDLVDDIIVGASSAAPSGRISAGIVYVIYGKTGGLGNVDLSTPLTLSQGFQISGSAPNDLLGTAVSWAGDINHDGIYDIMIGAGKATPPGYTNAGIVYIIYGKTGGQTSFIDLTTPLSSTQGFRILGGTASEKLGCSANLARDVNLDGIDDIIIGANSAAPSGRTSAGAAYVIYGKAGGFSGDVDLSAPLTLSQGFQISGSAPGDQLGNSVSSGDFNNDGIADIIVGSPFSSPSAGSQAGTAYILYSPCPLANCVQCAGSKCKVCAEGYIINNGDGSCIEGVSGVMQTIAAIQSSASYAASLAASTITLINYINPGGFLFVALSDLLQYMKYMSIDCPPRLAYLLQQQGSGKTLSITDISSAPPAIANGIEKYNLADNFARNSLHSSFLVNFWSSLMTLLIIGVAIVIFCGIAHLTRNMQKANPSVLKVKEALKWNYLLGTIIGYCGSVALFTAIEVRSEQFGSALGILSFILCLVINISLILVSVKMTLVTKKLTQQKDATRVETLKQEYKEYCILFETSKTDSFITQAYFLFSCLRLYLFYLIVGYLFEHPLVQAILINILCFVFLFYLILKRPLKSRLDLVESLLLEFLLLIVNACVLGLTIIDQTEHIITNAAVFLGDVVIVCNGLLLIIGCVYLFLQFADIVIEVVKVIKEHFAKTKNMASAKVSTMKPSQVEADSSLRNSQIDLSVMNDSHRPIISQYLSNSERSEMSKAKYKKTLVEKGSKPTTLIELINDDSQVRMHDPSRKEMMKQRTLSQNSSLLMTHKVSVVSSSRNVSGDLTIMNNNNDVSIPSLKRRKIVKDEA